LRDDDGGRFLVTRIPARNLYEIEEHMIVKKVWHTAGVVFVVATGMALWALLREDHALLEQKETELERLRNLGAA
jgi:hypothetical protein